MVVKRSVGEIAFDSLNVLAMLAGAFLFLYPMWYVLVSSLSDAYAIAAGRVRFWPIGFNLDAYKLVFEDAQIWTAYRNTLLYVAGGTLINLVLTTLGAYPLSRSGLDGRGFIMAFIVFTMFFSGGLIPMYLNVRELGLYDTPWALLLPGAISAFNLVVMRTFFQTIPDSLVESAKIDGAGDFRILLRIVLPLSLPVLAVMTLFYAVAHWNSWFAAMIYLQDRNLFPLQLILREILIQSSAQNMLTGASQDEVFRISESIKFATIIVATLPILMIYPFLQKYFVKGVMIGALKE
ncbi:carbohydrate ABC transporter permease [Paenibacillus sp. IB182496]|uniref:Carbohydrate ABC transporter permease n=1 Tax=Paenibacillus sabuli TaxID=2772509 RepID=A0A927BNA9_9BACL|nr:carbohydrate ABC transporter permease [Paenibacillus sabuli]MBD2843688.1 carbohydrate ABC transporter permease [Paenibacillus sabuli]